MKRKLFCIFILLKIIGITAYSQVYLSLDSCRQLALQHQQLSKSANMQVEKLKAEVNAYRANFFPRVYLQGAYLMSTSEYDFNRHYDLYNTSIPATISGIIPPILAPYLEPYLDQFYKDIFIDLDIKVKLNNTFFAAAVAEQPIYMGGKIIAAYKMSKLGLSMAKLNVSKTEAEVLVKCDQAYWQYVKVLELEQTALKYKKAVESVVTDAKNAVETGMNPASDLMKAQTTLADATLKVRQAENGKKLAKMNLCMNIGLPLYTDLRVLDTLPDDRSITLPSTIPDVTLRPEYELLENQLALKKQQINLVRSDFLPQVGILGSYTYANGVTLNDEKIFHGGAWSGILNIKIPITQWGEGAYRIKSAKADYLMAQYQMEENLNLLQLEIIKVYNTLDEALLKVEMMRLQLQQAEEELRVSKDRYELGLKNSAALMESQALWQQAWSNYIEAKADLMVAKTDYQRVSNQK